MRQPTTRRYTGIIVGLVVAVAGVAGVLFAASKLSQCTGSNCGSSTGKQVLVAAKTINAGDVIDPISVSITTVNVAPDDALTNQTDAIGKYAATTISQNTVLTPGLLHTTVNLQSHIPEFTLSPGNVAI